MYWQILILPLGQLRPLLDSAGACCGVWATGCKQRNVDTQGSMFAHPLELDIPKCDHCPVSSSNIQASIEDICTAATLLRQHSLEKAFSPSMFPGYERGFPSNPFYLPQQLWLYWGNHGIKTLKHQAEHENSICHLWSH